MSEPLYKAIHRQRYEDFALFANVSVPKEYVEGLMGLLLVGNRIRLLEEAREKLGDKTCELLNVYLDYDHTTYDVTTTYVFNNRDTALMFKLSLQ